MAQQGSGVAFSRMFYRDELPAGLEPVDFEFWSVPAHKLWRIELALRFKMVGYFSGLFELKPE